ncbi:MAG: divK [Labilithrix sp.]|nr:divK [Labilithrix sp.]
MTETPEPSAVVVLVVEDYEDARALYAEALANAGFVVDTAGDGREAIDKAKVLRPDVIVMDLAMPVMDGWQATQVIKSTAETKHAAVIVVSGHATSLGIERARDAGADHVLMKPILPQQLVGAVRAAAPRR